MAIFTSQTRCTTASASFTGSLLVALGLLACGDGGAAPLLPADYRATFVRVYGCRPSIDHDLRHVAVLASPAASEAYRTGVFPLPPGALIVKEEFSDDACASLVGWTLMRKESPGYAPDAGDWRWQRLDGERHVLLDGKPRACVSCHQAPACRTRDFTCVEP